MFRNGQLWMIDNKGVQDCKLWVDIIISNIYLPRLVIFVMKNVTVIIINNILHTKHDFFSSLRKVRDIKGFWCLAVSIVPGFLSPMEDAGCVKIGGYFEERSICHFRRQREQKETFLSSNKQAKLKQTFREDPWSIRSSGISLERIPELLGPLGRQGAWRGCSMLLRFCVSLTFLIILCCSSFSLESFSIHFPFYGHSIFMSPISLFWDYIYIYYCVINC